MTEEQFNTLCEKLDTVALCIAGLTEVLVKIHDPDTKNRLTKDALKTAKILSRKDFPQPESSD